MIIEIGIIGMGGSPFSDKPVCLYLQTSIKCAKIVGGFPDMFQQT